MPQYNQPPTNKEMEAMSTEHDGVPPWSAEELEIALKESLKLQTHYGELLNQYDGGGRRVFLTINQWILRLKEIGKIKEAEEVRDELPQQSRT